MGYEPGILWNVLEEHLDEAAFYFEQREAALASPLYTLDELAAGPERLMLAHEQGLVAGGQAVIERLLIPTLEDEDSDPGEIFVAAHLILSTASTELCAKVTAQLETAEDERWTALVRALELCERAGFGPWLTHGLERCGPAGLAGRLRALPSHAVPADARALEWLRADDPRVIAASCRWLWDAGGPEVLAALREPLVHDDARVRVAALDAACMASPEQLGPWFGQLAVDADPKLRERAQLWLALLGDASSHQRLIAELGAWVRPWAASFCGRVAAVDAAIELLADETLGPEAGELVQAIAGLPDDDAFWAASPADQDDGLPPFEDDDLDAELVPEQAADLRRPKPEAIAAWWSGERSRLDPGVRHIRGAPMTRETMVEALTAQSCRRRHALALEISARTRGQVSLDASALAPRQRATIEAVPGLELQEGLT